MPEDEQQPRDTSAVPVGQGSDGGPGRDDLAAAAGFPDSVAAARAVLAQLREELDFGLWAVTRISGGTYAVLHAGEEGFPAAVGEPLTYAETLCRRVLEGRSPRIAPDVQAVPALREAPLTDRWQVGAYLSVPLSVDGVSVFGTLCALDPRPRPSEVVARLPLVELQARLLSTVLAAELELDSWRGRAARAEADALLDPMTGLVNRRGWQLLLDREEQRCARYGAVASVLVLDLDGLKAVNDQQGHAAGDLLIRRASQLLREAFRSTDVVARLGGDEFAVLAIETDPVAALHERDRVQGLFDRARLPASLGVAARRPVEGLAGAWVSADSDMYRVKRAKSQP